MAAAYDKKELPATTRKQLTAFMEMAEWYCKHRRPLTVKDLRPIATKYFPTEKEFIEFLEYLKSPEGQNEFRRELRDAMRRHGISIPPEEEWLPLTSDVTSSQTMELTFTNLIRSSLAPEQLALYPMDTLLNLRKELGRAISISPFDTDLRATERRLLKAINIKREAEKLGETGEKLLPLIHKEDKTWYLGEWWEQEYSTAECIVYRSADGKKRLYVYWDGTKEVKPRDEKLLPALKPFDPYKFAEYVLRNNVFSDTDTFVYSGLSGTNPHGVPDHIWAEVLADIKGEFIKTGDLYIVHTPGVERPPTMRAAPTWREPSGELSLETIDLLAETEGDPIRKFCCRQCGECAPAELLEEGKFPERIAWLRSHYKAKHPGMWGKMQAAVIPTQPSPPSPTISRWRRVRKGEVTPRVKETFGITREKDRSHLEKRRITHSGKPLIGHLAKVKEERDIWLWPKTEFSHFEDFINTHLAKWSQLMKTGVPDCLISDADEDLFYSTTHEIVMPAKMARLYEQKPQDFGNLLFWVAHEFFHYVAEEKGLTFEAGWDEEDYANRMAEHVTSIPMPNAITTLHDTLIEVWDKEVGVSLSEALAKVPAQKDRIPLPEWLSAVIPTQSSPPSPREELEFVSDSPEYLAYTIEDIGYREKLDTAFETAIARAKGR